MTAALNKTGLSRLPLRAAIFVALACAAIIASTGWTEWASRDSEMRNAEIELGNLSRSLVQHADDTVELAGSLLAGMVAALEADSEKPERIARLQTFLNVRKPGLGRIHGLFVYDETGRWLATTEAVNLAEHSNDDRDYFQYHRNSPDRATFVGRPVHSKSGGQWVITLSRRWNHADGSFAGVVLATVDVSYFWEFYSHFDIGTHGSIALISKDGIILARNPDDGSVGRDVSDRPVFKGIGRRASEGAMLFKSAVDGVQRLGFYKQSDRYPFVIVITKAQSDVLARWRHNAIYRVLFVLSLVALIAMMGFYLVRQLLSGQRMAVALVAKEANFRVLAESSSDMVTRIGLDERISYVSPSCVSVVGWRPDQLTGTAALAGVNVLDLPRVEKTVAALRRGDAEEARISYRTRHREKAEIWVESNLRVTRKVDGEIDGVVAISRDITEQKVLEERLEILAVEDGLTGLANRRRFDERLQEEWARSARDSTPLSLLMIDVDQFKTFNDQYGHPAGDDCLRSVARVLAAETKRTSDLAARYGGEEFVLLLPNTAAAGCARIGERIRRELQKAAIPHKPNLPSGRVTASLGGAVCWPGSERSASHASLVEAADRALYAAKEAGRDRLVMAGQVVALLPLLSTAR
jgi:diguanylate cyclase (GGDEF)-like protein/PAS domain S-box-containing protein